LFNSVHLWRRNRDGNEEITHRICGELRRIAANIAKLPEHEGSFKLIYKDQEAAN
jgi:hypothetical protein